MDIKTITLEPGSSFEANGKKYTVSETFSIGRFEQVEEIEEEAMMMGENKTCHDTMLRAMAKINEYNPGEAYALLYNKIETDQRNIRVTHFLLKICAAYINAEGEDTKYLNDEMIKTKIKDWSEECLDVRPFLALAVQVCSELGVRYKKPIQDILSKQQKVLDLMEEELGTKSLMEDSGPVRL